MEAARQQGIGDLRAVAVGILESDGKFSFVTTEAWKRQQQAGQDTPATCPATRAGQGCAR